MLVAIVSFQYKDKTYLLDNNFVFSHYMKCDICGNYPTINVSVIRNKDGDRLNTCYNCIDIITKQNVSIWFKTFSKKRENLLENRKYINGLSVILAAYDLNELPFKISSEDVEKLRKTFVQMCNGLNPKTKQKQLAEYYIEVKSRNSSRQQKRLKSSEPLQIFESFEFILVL